MQCTVGHRVPPHRVGAVDDFWLPCTHHLAATIPRLAPTHNQQRPTYCVGHVDLDVWAQEEFVVSNITCMVRVSLRMQGLDSEVKTHLVFGVKQEDCQP